MKFLYFFLILGLGMGITAAAECGPAPKTGSFVAVTIEPKLGGGSPTLDVSVSFRVSGSKSADLILPSEWEGQRDLYRAIHDLEIVSPGAALLPGRDAGSRHVTFPLGQVVQMRYRVIKDWIGPIDASSYFRVILDPTYFQIAGRNFLVYPALPEDESLPIFVEWKNLPSGWRAVDSLAQESPCQTITTNLIKLSNGLFTGGALRIQKLDLDGKSLVVATRGQWNFSDDAFSDLAHGILSEEREFWHDVGASNYLISLLPSDDSVGNYGGAALEDSFALLTSVKAHLDFATRFLLAHEMFHSWNSAKLGEIRSETPYWFTEGFTDYYARMLLLRAKLITPEEFATDVQASRREYLASRVLHASGKEQRERFFTNFDFQRLAYLRGDFLAFRWNRLIQIKTDGKRSLDDAMLDLERQAQRKEILLTSDFLASHFESYVGPDAVRDVQRFIDQGDTIPYTDSPAAESER